MTTTERLFLCLWCKAQKSRAEMRGKSGGTGPVPSICDECRSTNTGLSWCKYHEQPHELREFRVQRQRPDLICMRATYELTEAPSKQVCPWCGETKTNAEMKGAEGIKGYPPATCAACRAAHPTQHWCTYHGEPHDRTEFEVKAKRLVTVCRLGRHEMRYPDVPQRQCGSCFEHKSPGHFSGRGMKRFVCKQCVKAHPGSKWCRACKTWHAIALFPKGAESTGSMCILCKAAERHHTTVAAVSALQGVSTPRCAVCGSTVRLHIDHDHGCCPGFRSSSCGKCVRGWLCYRCNTAEGSLRTSERAYALARYLERHEQREQGGDGGLHTRRSPLDRAAPPSPARVAGGVPGPVPGVVAVAGLTSAG